MLKKQNEVLEKTKKEEKEKYNQLLCTEQHIKDKKIKDVENKLKKEKNNLMKSVREQNQNELKKALEEKDNLMKVVI
jgi:basic membrane lipoprotein Med (substrate-binding protein (PBP1-ABC) superfamily)